MANRRQMTSTDEDNCAVAAVFTPDKFGALTPGEFADRFGVPDDDQWAALSELVVYDEAGKIRSVVPERLPVGY